MTQRILPCLKQIDQSLLYFAFTSGCKQISFDHLQKLVNGLLQLSDFEEIIAFWPDAYQYTITQQNLPKKYITIFIDTTIDVAQRQNTMTKILNGVPLQRARQQGTPSKFNTLNNSSPLTTKILISNLSRVAKPTRSLSSTRLESLHKVPKSFTDAMNQKISVNTANGLSLAERIKWKELLHKQVEAQANDNTIPKKTVEEALIHDYLEQICLILLSLQCKSYPLPYIATKLSDSLRSKLSATESENAVHELAKIIPEFCSIVSSGRIHAVKIRSGWDLDKIKQRLVHV